MTSRFYFSDVAPSYAGTTNKGTWSVAPANAYELGTSPKGAASGTATVSSTSQVGTGTTGRTVGWNRYVSPPALANGTIAASSPISGVVGVWKNQANGVFTAQFRLHVWVTQGDTNNVRGTLWTYNSSMGASTFPNANAASATGLTIPTVGVANAVAVQAGDRLVVEIGWLYTLVGTGAGTHSATMFRGIPMVLSGETGNQEPRPASASTDLTNGGDETLYPGWIDFAADGIWSTRFADISDDFDDNAIGTLWPNSYENYKEEDGMLQVGAFFTGTSGVYSGAYTEQKYQLRDSSVFIKLVDVPGPVNATPPGGVDPEAWCSITIKSQVTGSSVECFYNAETGELHFRDNQSYSNIAPATFVTYVPATHRWMRISESAGTMTYATSTEVSATAVWDTRRTVTTHGWHRYQNLAIIVQAYRNADDPDDWSKWDNLNVVPPAGPTNAQKSGGFLHAA